MTYSSQKNEFGIWDTSSQVFCMLWLDEFIMLTLDDRHRNADLFQIL